MTALPDSGTQWSSESTVMSYLLCGHYARQMILRFIKSKFFKVVTKFWSLYKEMHYVYCASLET